MKLPREEQIRKRAVSLQKKSDNQSNCKGSKTQRCKRNAGNHSFACLGFVPAKVIWNWNSGNFRRRNSNQINRSRSGRTCKSICPILWWQNWPDRSLCSMKGIRIHSIVREVNTKTSIWLNIRIIRKFILHVHLHGESKKTSCFRKMSLCNSNCAGRSSRWQWSKRTNVASPLNWPVISSRWLRSAKIRLDRFKEELGIEIYNELLGAGIGTAREFLEADIENTLNIKDHVERFYSWKFAKSFERIWRNRRILNGSKKLKTSVTLRLFWTKWSTRKRTRNQNSEIEASAENLRPKKSQTKKFHRTNNYE